MTVHKSLTAFRSGIQLDWDSPSCQRQTFSLQWIPCQDGIFWSSFNKTYVPNSRHGDPGPPEPVPHPSPALPRKLVRLRDLLLRRGERDDQWNCWDFCAWGIYIHFSWHNAMFMTVVFAVHADACTAPASALKYDHSASALWWRNDIAPYYLPAAKWRIRPKQRAQKATPATDTCVWPSRVICHHCRRVQWCTTLLQHGRVNERCIKTRSNEL